MCRVGDLPVATAGLLMKPAAFYERGRSFVEISCVWQETLWMMKHDLPWPLSLERLRAASWRPRAAPHERAAILLTPPSLDLRSELASLAALLKQAAPDDIVVTLNVAQLLADRCSPSRAMLQALLNRTGDEGWLTWMRQRVSPGLAGRSWLFQRTDLSRPGAARVAAALARGDFGALDALLAYDNPLPSHQEGESYVAPEEPLSEQDARALLVFLLASARPPRRSCWVILDGLEACLCGGGRLSSGFRSGLQAWWRHMQRLDGVILLSSCWSQARPLLGSVDRGLARLCLSPDAELRRASLACGDAAEVSSATSPTLQGPSVARLGVSLARGLSLNPPQRLEDEDVWCLQGQGRRALLVWPSQARHPARHVLRLTADLVEGLSGYGPALVLVPDWAWGQECVMSRSALRRAFPVLRWAALTTSAAHELCDADTVEESWWGALEALWEIKA